MPLDKRPTREAISSNVRELTSTGKYHHKQAIAIALDTARRAGAKIGVKKKRKRVGVKKG